MSKGIPWFAANVRIISNLAAKLFQTASIVKKAIIYNYLQQANACLKTNKVSFCEAKNFSDRHLFMFTNTENHFATKR